MVATCKDVIQLIDNGVLVYSSVLNPDRDNACVGTFQEIVYISDLNCYLMNLEYKLFRKDIDDQDPYLFMDIECCGNEECAFRYSEVSKRLYVISDRDSLMVVNLQRKQVEINLKGRGTHESSITDLKVFGGKGDQVAILSKLAQVHLLQFSIRRKKVCSSYWFSTDLIFAERARAIAVCDKNKLIFVAVAVKRSLKRSRICIFKLEKRSLNHRATFNQEHNKQSMALSCVECAGYFGGAVLWVGLNSPEDYCKVFSFDTDTGKLRELGENRVLHGEYSPQKIQRVGNEFFYTGWKRKVMRLTLTTA